MDFLLMLLHMSWIENNVVHELADHFVARCLSIIAHNKLGDDSSTEAPTVACGVSHFVFQVSQIR